MFYLFIENSKIIGSGQCPVISDEILNIEVTEDTYNNYNIEPLMYIWNGSQIVINPNYEEEKQEKERAEIDKLMLTPSDVERALYKAKGMDFEDLKQLITERIPTIDIKALAIEFRAKDFYRGAMLADGTRLFDTIGLLLEYNSPDIDYLFLNKTLPEKVVE